MPVVPEEGEETICEINREFVTARPGDGGQAQQRYSKIVGRVFPRVAFRVAARASVAEDEQDEHQKNANAGQASLVDRVAGILRRKAAGLEGFKKGLGAMAISWHKHRLFVAFVAAGQVLVVDYEEAEVKEPYVLSHETQQQVQAVEWRPNSGSMLAVGCEGGVCLWSSSLLNKQGLAPSLGSPGRTAASRWIQADFLRCGRRSEQACISALSWSPCGRFLASGSLDNATFTVWDVAQGESSPLRRGLAGVQLLRWSPFGDYLLAAKVDASFHLYETMSWTSEPWSSSGGAVVNSAWSPEGRMLLCAFEQSRTLGALHFAGKPPSLEVHLLPVELPDIGKLAGAGGAVEMLAWDGTGERLAVSYHSGGSSNPNAAAYEGLIAIYDTRRSPITIASLLGFIKGPGNGAKPLAFSFHNRLSQGALLGVCWSTGVFCAYPLLFRTTH